MAVGCSDVGERRLLAFVGSFWELVFNEGRKVANGPEESWSVRRERAECVGILEVERPRRVLPGAVDSGFSGWLRLDDACADEIPDKFPDVLSDMLFLWNCCVASRVESVCVLISGVVGEGICAVVVQEDLAAIAGG